MGDFRDLIGKKVVAIRGMKNTDKRKKKVPLEYMLFDDGQTFLEFNEQDPYSYHDCSYSARHIEMRVEAPVWERIMNDETCYADSTEDFYFIDR